MKTINEQIEKIIINTVGVGLEGEYPYKIKLTNVDQAAKEIVALKQRVEKEKSIQKCIYNQEWNCGADTNWCNSCDLKPKFIYNAGFTESILEAKKEKVTDEEVQLYIDNLNCGDAYKLYIRFFWKWIKDKLKTN